MAKKVIQMYDKYKSTTKIYPKVIKECFQDDAKEYIEGQVKANPTLAGTEASLTGLEVGGTKYKVEQPINVVANPTLAGTEADLESIEIGETKYKIGGGGKQLYQHNFYIISAVVRLTAKITTDSSTQMTANDLANYLYSNGLTTNEKCIEATGWHQNQNDNNWTDLICGIYSTSSIDSGLQVSWFRGGTELFGSFGSSSKFVDTVITL